MSSMSINDDDKLRSLKESWAQVENQLKEEQMAGTEDKHGHENVKDQGKEVTKTGNETNPEDEDGAQHTRFSKPVRNGPSFPVKENPDMGGGDDDFEGMEDPDVIGGDDMGDEIGGDDLGDDLGAVESPWDRISRAFGDLQSAFDELKASEGGDDLGDIDGIGGDDLGIEDEVGVDEVVGRYEVTESAKNRMARIKAKRANKK